MDTIRRQGSCPSHGTTMVERLERSTFEDLWMFAVAVATVGLGLLFFDTAPKPWRCSQCGAEEKAS